MIDGDAIKELRDGFAEPHRIDDLVATPDGWTLQDPQSLIKPGPTAAPLAVATLAAVRDYLIANKDDLALSSWAVHVVSPILVRIVGPLDARARAREIVLTASCADQTDQFLGRFTSIEDFLIGLQIRFTDAGDRAKVLRLLSNVRDEGVKTSIDDGVSQVVSVRAGVTLSSEVAVPNPITLAGFRTFRDVAQPAAIYVLRVRGGKEGGLPEVAIFEADGGAWRLDATKAIADWLHTALASSPVAIYA